MSNPIESEPRSEAWAATAEPLGEVDSDDVDESALDPKTLAVLQKARREARSLRARLRDAEQIANRVPELEERLGAASARETERDRREAERLASEVLIDPTDLWAESPDVQRFYDSEFATVVPDRVRDAAAAIIEAKPHLARPQPTPPPTQRPIEGLRSGARPAGESKPTTWSSALGRG